MNKPHVYHTKKLYWHDSNKDRIDQKGKEPIQHLVKDIVKYLLEWPYSVPLNEQFDSTQNPPSP